MSRIPAILEMNVFCTLSSSWISLILVGCHKGQQYSTRLRTINLYKVSMVVGDRVWNTLRTHDAFCRAFSAMARMWGDHDRSLEIRMSRSRSWCTGSRVVSADTVYWLSLLTKGSSGSARFLLNLWHMYSNLSLWSAMLFLSHHLMTLYKSGWRRLTSFSHLIAMDMLVSSAKHLMMECTMHWSMSLIKIRNKIGPSTVPWGTPLRMRARIESLPSTTTACFGSRRNDSIHLTIFGWAGVFSEGAYDQPCQRLWHNRGRWNHRLSCLRVPPEHHQSGD